MLSNTGDEFRETAILPGVIHRMTTPASKNQKASLQVAGRLLLFSWDALEPGTG